MKSLNKVIRKWTGKQKVIYIGGNKLKNLNNKTKTLNIILIIK